MTYKRRTPDVSDFLKRNAQRQANDKRTVHGVFADGVRPAVAPLDEKLEEWRESGLETRAAIRWLAWPERRWP